ncbi:hypothetical protein OAG62_00830, partial [bacterium]|nr:hypothetical protein [bacterium]
MRLPSFGISGYVLLASLLVGLSLSSESPADDRPILLEAEAFDDLGGWVLDQQFMDLMGSPFLLAHGMGQPVADARTEAEVSSPGRHRVWVRTRDWVAPWKASGAPGRFQVLIDGKPLETTFGTEGNLWHWQDGGYVTLGERVIVGLHDLTGFEGRCDAVILIPEGGPAPPEDSEALRRFRRAALGHSDEPVEA